VLLHKQKTVSNIYRSFVTNTNKYKH